jgi:hypothetical protein
MYRCSLLAHSDDKNATRGLPATRIIQAGDGRWTKREARMPMRIAERARNVWVDGRRSRRGFYSRAANIGLVAVTLGGCMTLGDTTPAPFEPGPATVAELPLAVVVQPAPTPPAPAPRPKRVARESKPVPELRALRDKLVLIDPDKLIGMDTQGVQKLLGAPVRVKNDDLSREWVYAAPGCSFRVFFYPNLNSASFRVLKYGGSGDNGELLDVSDVCVRRILTAKSNAEN